jgi:hypothetical protein
MLERERVIDCGEDRYKIETNQESILLQGVREALSFIKYGEITVVIRNGKVVEIESVSRNRPKARKEL